jgi:sporulation protein YlmC with PRC-barrel domain
MKLNLLAAASGLALSAFLVAAPANGQGRVDANGNPTNESTPAEKAETAAINNQVQQNNAAADAQAQAQQQQYQNQLQQNQAAQQSYQNAKANYANEIANYDAIRERYARERAAYVRGVWPARYARLMIVNAETVIGERVQLITGARVGTVIDVDLNASQRVSALLVRLDNDQLVWIDSGDVRYHRADGVVMTSLDRRDLYHMADQRL